MSSSGAHALERPPGGDGRRQVVGTREPLHEAEESWGVGLRNIRLVVDDAATTVADQTRMSQELEQAHGLRPTRFAQIAAEVAQDDGVSGVRSFGRLSASVRSLEALLTEPFGLAVLAFVRKSEGEMDAPAARWWLT